MTEFGHAVNRVRALGSGALAVLLLTIGIGGPALAATPPGFADLVEKGLPAVVDINVSQDNAGLFGEAPGWVPEDSPLREFFERRFGDRIPDSRPRQGSGTGFFIDPDGYIVTNHHVVDEADEITVLLSDGSSFPAEVVGSDEKTDLALLKIEADGALPHLELGDSDDARVGDWVIAIGNPYGFGGSVSAGIISARNRNINQGPYDDYIQTDAAINFGNSGGPLLNLEGEVIGVNSAIISPSQGSVGIAFAVPSAIVTDVVGQLLEYGQTRRGWLGVQFNEVTEEIAESLGLETAMGGIISNVLEDTPASQAGLRKGDVILVVGGSPVEEARDLPRIVAAAPVGEETLIEIWRDGRRMEIPVTLGRLEEADINLRADSGSEDPVERAIEGTGLTVVAIDDAVREEFGLDETIQGVLVTEVDPESDSARKGISEGDVIVSVDMTNVERPEDFAAQVDSARSSGRRSILLLMLAGDRTHFVGVRLGS